MNIYLIFLRLIGLFWRNQTIVGGGWPLTGQGRRIDFSILTSSSISTELFVRLGGSKKIKYKNFCTLILNRI
jgi:hypothetical protein